MPTFRQHCKDKNINLLKDDIKHIEKCCKMLPLPVNEKKKVLMQYAEIWLDAEKKQTGQGRREANLFLLRMVHMQPVA